MEVPRGERSEVRVGVGCGDGCPRTVRVTAAEGRREGSRRPVGGDVEWNNIYIVKHLYHNFRTYVRTRKVIINKRFAKK